MDEDELPEWKRPQPKIDLSKLDAQDPEGMLKMTKQGRTLMMFATVSGMLTSYVFVAQMIRCLFFVEINRNNRPHTHPFNSPLSGTTQVSQYQKGKTNLDFTEARDSEWQWH